GVEVERLELARLALLNSLCVPALPRVQIAQSQEQGQEEQNEERDGSRACPKHAAEGPAPFSPRQVVDHQDDPRAEADTQDEQVGYEVGAEELGAVEVPGGGGLVGRGVGVEEVAGDATQDAQSQANDTGSEGRPLDAVPGGPRQQLGGVHRWPSCWRHCSCSW